MLACEVIREREEGEDNLVELLHSYLVSTQGLDTATDFINNDEIKAVLKSNYDVQKFAINRYFKNLLVTAAGSRMVKTENSFESKLDIRVPLLNIQTNISNIDWYNLIVNGVIKYALDNDIKLK